MYIFITRIPRGVYIILGDFSKISFFPPLVDIYRHPLLRMRYCSVEYVLLIYFAFVLEMTLNLTLL